jgi:hypothetical protein
MIPDPLYTQALIKPYKKTLIKKKLKGKEYSDFVYRKIGIYTLLVSYRLFIYS